MKKQKSLKLVKRGEPPPEVEQPAGIGLTPSEQAEIARFKALTIKRAKKRAAVSRLIAKLQGRLSPVSEIEDKALQGEDTFSNAA